MIGCLISISISDVVHDDRFYDFVGHATHRRREEKYVVGTDVVKVKVEANKKKNPEAR